MLHKGYVWVSRNTAAKMMGMTGWHLERILRKQGPGGFEVITKKKPNGKIYRYFRLDQLRKATGA